MALVETALQASVRALQSRFPAAESQTMTCLQAVVRLQKRMHPATSLR